MFIKIYFGSKPLFLCDAIDDTLQPYVHHDDTVFIDELDAHTVKTILHEMHQPAVHAGVFLHSDLDALRKALFKKFVLIQAGGGLVENDQEEVLLIFRRGKWDMPKGKLDPGETLEACAVREVEEETGLSGIQLGDHILTTYHVYPEGAHQVLKESHWYGMRVSGEQQLVPQTQEDIQQVIWVKKEELNEYQDKVFPSVADLIHRYLAL